MVIICFCFVLLTASIKDAKVVDFPVPVAPVISTKPVTKSRNYWIINGKLSSAIDFISKGIERKERQ